MRKFIRVAFKVLIGIFLSAVLLVLLADGAVNLALRSRCATRLAQKYVGEYLDGDLVLGNGSFRFLTTFPNAKLVLRDVFLTEAADTTAGFVRLEAKADLPALMKKRICVPLVRLEGLQVHRWDFYHFPSGGDSTSTALPAFTVHAEVPQARLSYAPLSLRDARVSLFGDAGNAETLDARVDSLRLGVDGLHVDIRGTLQDIMGEDPSFDLDGSMDARLQSLQRYLPASLKGLVAEGDVDLTLGGRGRLSQLSTKRINETDLRARLSGDRIRVSFQEDSLFAHADSPAVTLATHAGGPVTASVQAGTLELKDSRALVLRLVDMDTEGTLTQEMAAGDTLPRLTVTSAGQRLLLRAGTERLAFNDFSLKAKAQLGDGRIEIRPASAERRLTLADPAAADTSALPEWLQDRAFMASDIDFRLGESVASLLRRWNPEAELDVPQAVFISPLLPLRNILTDFHARVDNDRLDVTSARLISGTSDLALEGHVSGLRRMLVEGERGVVNLDVDMRSKMLNINELLAAFAESASLREQVSAQADTLDDEAYMAAVVQEDLADVEMTAETHSLIVVPANVVGKARLRVQNVDYSDFDFYGVQADAAMQERTLQLTNAAASTLFGNITLDAFYSTKTRQNISAGFNLGLSDITAENVIALIPSVDSLMPVLKNFQGSLDCVLAATAQLDTLMNIQLPTMDGMFRISGEDLRFSGLDSLNRFVKWLLFQRREVGRIDDMMVSGVISDNELEVFPFAVTMDRYSLALSGTQQFDGQFDYKVSVVHSPLPFRFGLRLYGPNFDKIRFRLGKTQFTDTKKIPLFHTEVNDMQVNLVDAIRNVFSRGVEKVLDQQRYNHNLFDASRGDLSFLEFDDDIDADVQAEMEELSVEMDIEEEAAAVNAEIDRMFEELWQI